MDSISIIYSQRNANFKKVFYLNSMSINCNGTISFSIIIEENITFKVDI